MKSSLVAILLMQFAALAFAQSTQSVQTSVTGSASASAAAFSCGGVGEEDQRRMKAEAGQHDLLVTFSTVGGAYIADVEIEIASGGKVVVQGRCGGPLMLVDLSPKGSYEIRATAHGKTQRKLVSVGGKKPTSVSFAW
jgi:hypothetical protein